MNYWSVEEIRRFVGLHGELNAYKIEKGTKIHRSTIGKLLNSEDYPDYSPQIGTLVTVTNYLKSYNPLVEKTTQQDSSKRDGVSKRDIIVDNINTQMNPDDATDAVDYIEHLESRLRRIDEFLEGPTKIQAREAMKEDLKEDFLSIINRIKSLIRR